MSATVYVTGDTHCPIDIRKLQPGEFPQGQRLTKDDYVVICGDSGFVWFDRDVEDVRWQQWCVDQPWTTLFVDGNHENHARLASMPVESWHGGHVHRINDSLLHLMRGEVFEIAGNTVFVMGGGTSIDADRRRPYRSWWPEEMPGIDEYLNAERNLRSCGWRVDYILTHEAPTSLLASMGQGFRYDQLTRFLDLVDRRVTFKHWYFGHYHLDRDLDARHTVLFRDIRVLGA